MGPPVPSLKIEVRGCLTQRDVRCVGNWKDSSLSYSDVGSTGPHVPTQAKNRLEWATSPPTSPLICAYDFPELDLADFAADSSSTIRFSKVSILRRASSNSLVDLSVIAIFL